MFKTYLVISIVLLSSFWIVVGLNQFILKRNIKSKEKSVRKDTVRRMIKHVVWCFIPVMWPVMLYSVYVNLTKTDDELVIFLNKAADADTYCLENPKKEISEDDK